MSRTHECELLADAALATAAYAPWASDWPICGFMASVGSHYDQTLMVVGRAVNGWTNSWSAAELGSARAASDFAAEALRGVSDPGDGSGPMSWVAEQWGSSEDYNTARSAF